MSGINPGNLHGTGSGPRPSKLRYQYARQRVQDTQKGKMDEAESTKKEDTKAGKSNNGIIIILIIMIGVTWGIAATAYFGVVDYKGLVVSSTKLQAIDAADYVSALYPFQYDAVRHPLRAIGSVFTYIDDTITNLFLFERALFEISDKRRIVTSTPVNKFGYSKKDYNMVKRDAETEPATKLKNENVIKDEVEKVKSSKKSEQDKAKPESTKKSKPKTATGADDKKPVVENKQEKQKDVALTLNLQVYVGEHRMMHESSLTADNGTVLKIGTIDKNDGKKQQKIKTKCQNLNTKSILFATSPLNKNNVAFCNKYPLVPRLVLQGNMINPTGYYSLPSYTEGKVKSSHPESRVVVNTVPIPKVFMEAMIKVDKVDESKVLGHFSQRNVVTNPFETSDNLMDKNVDKNADNFVPESCNKPCSLELRFLNKKLGVKEPDSKQENLENRVEKNILASNTVVNKSKAKQKRSVKQTRVKNSNHKLTLPNTISKINLEKNTNDEEIEFMPFSGQKLTLPNPTNRLSDSVKFEIENERANSDDFQFYKGINVGSNVLNKEIHQRNYLDDDKMREKESSSYKTIVEPINPLNKFENGPGLKYNIKKAENEKYVIPLVPCNRMIKDIKYLKFLSSSSRQVYNPTISRILNRPTPGLHKNVDSQEFTILRNIRHIKQLKMYEKKLLYLRSAVIGTTVISENDQVNSNSVNRHETSKDDQLVLTPKAKLKRKLSRMYDKTFDVIHFIAEIFKQLSDIFLPESAQNFIEESRNSAAFAKILDVVVNTTLSDACQFTKNSFERFFLFLKQKSQNFYDFMKTKPAFENLVTKLSKFNRKLQLKFEKLSGLVAKHFFKLQNNQKFLTSVLITLSVVGFYHICSLVFNSTFPPRT